LAIDAHLSAWQWSLCAFDEHGATHRAFLRLRNPRNYREDRRKGKACQCAQPIGAPGRT
jgi:hypothetical protein